MPTSEEIYNAAARVIVQQWQAIQPAVEDNEIIPFRAKQKLLYEDFQKLTLLIMALEKKHQDRTPWRKAIDGLRVFSSEHYPRAIKDVEECASVIRISGIFVEYEEQLVSLLQAGLKAAESAKALRDLPFRDFQTQVIESLTTVMGVLELHKAQLNCEYVNKEISYAAFLTVLNNCIPTLVVAYKHAAEEALQQARLQAVLVHLCKHIEAGVRHVLLNKGRAPYLDHYAKIQTFFPKTAPTVTVDGSVDLDAVTVINEDFSYAVRAMLMPAPLSPRRTITVSASSEVSVSPRCSAGAVGVQHDRFYPRRRNV